MSPTFKTLFVALLASSAVLASPVPEAKALEKRGAVLSGQWDSESEAGGRFVLENNLWGKNAGTGWQNSQATSSSGTSVAWKTTYNWSGGQYNVKSYANLDLKSGMGKKLSAIGSIPTTWNWSYSSASSNLVADVSYDLWLANSPGGGGASSSSTFEIMVWLSTRGGAGPAGSQITTVSVNGISWRLFKGTVGTWTVFSFVAPYELTNYSQDLKPFFTYLSNSQGVSSSQYLVQAQAGTEPFTGSATLTTNSYTLSVN